MATSNFSFPYLKSKITSLKTTDKLKAESKCGKMISPKKKFSNFYFLFSKTNYILTEYFLLIFCILKEFCTQKTLGPTSPLLSLVVKYLRKKKFIVNQHMYNQIREFHAENRIFLNIRKHFNWWSIFLHKMEWFLFAEIHWEQLKNKLYPNPSKPPEMQPKKNYFSQKLGWTLGHCFFWHM